MAARAAALGPANARLNDLLALVTEGLRRRPPAPPQPNAGEEAVCPDERVVALEREVGEKTALLNAIAAALGVLAHEDILAGINELKRAQARSSSPSAGPEGNAEGIPPADTPTQWAPAGEPSGSRSTSAPPPGRGEQAALPPVELSAARVVFPAPRPGGYVTRPLTVRNMGVRRLLLRFALQGAGYEILYRGQYYETLELPLLPEEAVRVQLKFSGGYGGDGTLRVSWGGPDVISVALEQK